jgi:GNAT superfamily N-acetyltransferase
MHHEQVVVAGLVMERWTHMSCVADVAVGPDWATLYLITSGERRQGHATAVLEAARAYYEGQGKRFGGSVALNEAMARLYQKLGIHEYR